MTAPKVLSAEVYLMTQSDRPVVLVVDDAAESIDVARGVLGDEFQVKAAISGTKALDIVEQSPPDLILLDVMMPDMSGYEVCKQLKANPRSAPIPIVFATTLSDSDSEATGLDLGAVDYVTKPYVPALLRSRIRTHIALFRQQIVLERLVAERTQELLETRLEIIRRLGRAAEYRDNETGMHVLRMSHISRMVALRSGMELGQAELILQASPMHDIGKLGIPDRVLLKPSRLNAEEWALMQRHTSIGAAIIGEHPSELMVMARKVALYHHERWDGTGYPERLEGESIPLEARVVAIADVFDALLSIRPYKRAWSIKETVNYFEEQRGHHFEPRLVDALLSGLDQCLTIRSRFSDG
ncbi:MAG TPA: HD domain-containing phosphohydrolase [Polyangiaceae bacterium]|nr:HD domain-containing phosphohydrolase [Polyangiaceae bacterium]